MALFPIKVDLRSGKKGKTFEEIFSLLPQTPSSFFKPFCGIPIFAAQKSKCHHNVIIVEGFTNLSGEQSYFLL